MSKEKKEKRIKKEVPIFRFTWKKVLKWAIIILIVLAIMWLIGNFIPEKPPMPNYF